MTKRYVKSLKRTKPKLVPRMTSQYPENFRKCHGKLDIPGNEAFLATRQRDQQMCGCFLVVQPSKIMYLLLIKFAISKRYSHELPLASRE